MRFYRFFLFLQLVYASDEPTSSLRNSTSPDISPLENAQNAARFSTVRLKIEGHGSFGTGSFCRHGSDIFFLTARHCLKSHIQDPSKPISFFSTLFYKYKDSWAGVAFKDGKFKFSIKEPFDSKVSFTQDYLLSRDLCQLVFPENPEEDIGYVHIKDTTLCKLLCQRETELEFKLPQLWDGGEIHEPQEGGQYWCSRETGLIRQSGRRSFSIAGKGANYSGENFPAKPEVIDKFRKIDPNATYWLFGWFYGSPFRSGSGISERALAISVKWIYKIPLSPVYPFSLTPTVSIDPDNGYRFQPKPGSKPIVPGNSGSPIYSYGTKGLFLIAVVKSVVSINGTLFNPKIYQETFKSSSIKLLIAGCYVWAAPKIDRIWAALGVERKSQTYKDYERALLAAPVAYYALNFLINGYYWWQIHNKGASTSFMYPGCAIAQAEPVKKPTGGFQLPEL